MPIANLWPEEIGTDGGLEGPVVILKEQAALLGKTTKNLVSAEIESDSDESNSGNFRDRFVIYSNVIDYRYVLFSVEYPFEFYPVKIWWDGYPETMTGDEDGSWVVNFKEDIESREELEEELKMIFSNPKTVRIVQALIARSRQ